MNLEEAVLRAVAARSLRERALFLVSGGLTAAQVYDRLPETMWAELAPGVTVPEVLRRVGIAGVHQALNTLSERAILRRGRSSFGVMLASKGHRKVLVDVYRRA